jgi:hypothetical protein
MLFKLNLHTILFAITKTKVNSLKLITDTQRITRITTLLEDYSGIIMSPVSGCCLAYVPNITKKPIKQILHDISRYKIRIKHFFVGETYPYSFLIGNAVGRVIKMWPDFEVWYIEHSLALPPFNISFLINLI